MEKLVIEEEDIPIRRTVDLRSQRTLIDRFRMGFEKYFLNMNEATQRMSNVRYPPKFKKEPKGLQAKKLSAIREMLALKRTEEWNELQNKIKEKAEKGKSLKDLLKSLFNNNSYFVIIWKSIFACFNVLIVFLYFFKVVFLQIATNQREVDGKTDIEIKRNLNICYFLICAMFAFEFLISVTIIIFNGGSLFSFIKLPLKLLMSIPTPLKWKYYWLLPKFARVDLVERLFTSVEKICNIAINNYVHNYYLKISMTYLNQLFKYLLIFGLYAHFIGSVFAYSSNQYDYLTSLYFTLETFTTIGFGDVQPNDNVTLFILIMINMFIGVNLFYLITTNIKILYLKIYGFNRDTSFSKQFQSLIFSIQKSTGYLVPKRLKGAMSSYLVFRRGLCYKDLETKYEDVFKMCRSDVKNQIRKRLFYFLSEEYKIFFKDCNEEFMYKFFENFEPKIFKAGSTIIQYGKPVNKLYFLLNGELFAFDKNDEVIFGMSESTIFGDWEFLNKIVSDVTIKVNHKKSAYGFTLDKDTFNSIAKEDIVSAKNFILKSFYKKQKHLEWINGTNLNCELMRDIEKNPSLDQKINVLKKNISNLEFQLINLKSLIIEKL